MIIYTFGHSTHSLEEAERLLSALDVDLLIDIRTYPGSRYVPCWNKENIVFDSIQYMHLPALGGRRSSSSGSGNEGWRNKSFRNYADYMQASEFTSGILDLELRASLQTSAIMCAEAVPWRCHRSLVTDALLVRGWDVRHIIGDKISSASLTSFAQVNDHEITYPLEAS